MRRPAIRHVLSLVYAVCALGTGGGALVCDFCSGTRNCSLGVNVATAECSDEIVHRTNGTLVNFMRPLRYQQIRRDSFRCVHVRATSVSEEVFLFSRGCVYDTPEVNFCALPHAAFQGEYECIVCDDGDRCNGAVPASAVTPLPSAAIAWLLAAVALSVAVPLLTCGAVDGD